MVVIVVVIGFDGFDAGGGFGVAHFALLHGAGHFAGLEAEAVEQHEFGGADFFQIAAGEAVDVRVLIRADEVGDGDFVAADLFGDVAQNAEAADNIERFGVGRAGNQEGEEGGFPVFHVCSFSTGVRRFCGGCGAAAW